ncbi:MAG TPA: VOC family protein [Fimbriimonadaceae bacterium]|nr:VOC family protein [Fimbriimonadaceae bacterium]
MKINPYLNFDGQCEEAFKHYERCLGGKIVAMMDYGSAPMPCDMTPDQKKRIMHARLIVDDQVLMGSDAPQGRYERPQGLYVTVGISDVNEARKAFESLGEGGTVVMPFEPTFFAEGFGMLTDRFGTPWMVVCEKPM